MKKTCFRKKKRKSYVNNNNTITMMNENYETEKYKKINLCQKKQTTSIYHILYTIS